MTIKKFDTSFDTSLWIIFLALAVASWFIADNICAPRYEHVDNPIVKSYTYTNDDGDLIKSEYEAVWYHKNFSSPEIKLYDERFDKAYDVADEYIMEYESLMPESRYKAFFYRWFWVLFPLFVISAALLLYFGGGAIRDYILYHKVKNDPTFSNVAYFLFYDRICKSDDVKAMIPVTIDSYIRDKSQQLAMKYPASFVKLITDMLLTIRLNRDTKIRFFVSYLENTKDQLEYLKSLSAYWDSQIGKNPKAEQFKERIDNYRQLKYEKIVSTVTATEISSIISGELNSLFTEVMDGNIFTFNGDTSNIADKYKIPGNLYVTVETENTPRYFTWGTSDGSAKANLAAIDIRVKIYHYMDGKKILLWNKLLDAKCTYTAETLNVTDLYNNMIQETTKGFKASLEK